VWALVPSVAELKNWPPAVSKCLIGGRILTN
jgi:hypothetical protein